MKQVSVAFGYARSFGANPETRKEAYKRRREHGYRRLKNISGPLFAGKITDQLQATMPNRVTSD